MPRRLTRRTPVLARRLTRCTPVLARRLTRRTPVLARRLTRRTPVLFQTRALLTNACAFAQRPFSLGLPLFVCIRFQDLFHSPSGVLFAFPSRYWFTIGRSRVFSLGGWSPHLQAGFHVSRPTSLTPSPTHAVSSTGLSPAMATVSTVFDYRAR